MINVAVLGPKGTNTEEVAKKRWDKDANIHYFMDISEIFDSVMKGEMDYGIVPIEDNIEGDVRGTLNLFRTYEVFITEELYQEVKHSLLAKGRKEDIRRIFSHPQALAHCRLYLNEKFPNIYRQSVSSTAEAAKMASEDPSIGAIANERNAKVYGLNILEKDIHDWGSNTTKFFCIKDSPEPPKGPAKTSIIIYPQLDRPGILYEILEKFKKKNINLTWIESQPSWGELGEYLFYLTFKGSKADPDIQSLLNSIEDMDVVKMIRYLGSYSYDKDIQDSQKPKLKYPKNTIRIEENKLNINASNLEIGVSYSINYHGKEHLICRPQKGKIEIYEVN